MEKDKETAIKELNEIYPNISAPGKSNCSK